MPALDGWTTAKARDHCSGAMDRASWMPATTARWLPRPLRKRRLASWACGSPSRLTAIRKRCSAMKRTMGSVSSVPLVTRWNDTGIDSRWDRSSTSATSAWISGNPSNGSPPKNASSLPLPPAGSSANSMSMPRRATSIGMGRWNLRPR